MGSSLLNKTRDAYRQGGWGRVAAMAWAKMTHRLVLWRHRTAAGRWNPFVVAAARLVRHPVVHAIGDSHSRVLIGVFPFRVTWLGAATAFNVAKPGSATRSHEQVVEALRHVRPGDVLLLILGEVDTRIHIYYQHMKRGQAQSLTELIDATIERYGEFILGLARQGYRTVVQGVPAAPYWDNAFDYPYYADDETRSWIVREFNERLAAWCATNGVEYLDMYRFAADERGFIRPDVSTDRIHVDRSALPIYRDWVRRSVSPKGAK